LTFCFWSPRLVLKVKVLRIMQASFAV